MAGLLVVIVLADGALLLLWAKRPALQDGGAFALGAMQLLISLLIFFLVFGAARSFTRSVSAQFTLVYFFYALVVTVNIYLVYAFDLGVTHLNKWAGLGAADIPKCLQLCYGIGGILFVGAVTTVLLRRLWSRIAKGRVA